MPETNCSKCGSTISAGSRFCTGCGAPVNVGAAVASPPPGYAQPVQPPPGYAQPVQPPPGYVQQPMQPPPGYAQPMQPPPGYAQPVQPPPGYAQQPMQPPPGYAQPQSAPGVSTKQAVLANAPGALNRPDRPWAVTIEGDSIVARWKWMDATFFAPHEISDETKQFTFTVTLTDKGTWKELDRTENKKSGISMNGGKLSFGSSSNSFSGKTNQKSFSFGAGKNNQTGEVGFVAFKFNTTDVKQPVRDYLTACGWKQAGMFG